MRFLIVLKFQHSNEGYLLIQLVGVNVFIVEFDDCGHGPFDRRVALKLAVLQDLLNPWVDIGCRDSEDIASLSHELVSAMDIRCHIVLVDLIV